MLFSSPQFLLGFLPVVAVLFYGLSLRGGGRWLLSFLVAASFFFYAWWNPPYVVIFAASIAFNYLLCSLMRRTERVSRGLLVFGVVANLSLLGWFKYRAFILQDIFGVLDAPTFILASMPIGISFFTFQQIAWLIDSSRNREITASSLEYAGFVSFFPQLIAGPIVHHRQLVPQLKETNLRRMRPALIAAGLSLFALGLLKKVMVADSLAVPTALAFEAVEGNRLIAATSAWTGVLSYAGQIYFDFSGYSDMALGLGLIFGIRLPANFLSPYCAVNISDFWKRWHITLSEFLRDYLYIPLGGNRCGRSRHYLNLVLTMALGGLWHGAGLTFIAWGLAHGLLLVGLEVWRGISHAARDRGIWWPGISKPVGLSITLALVVLAWVPFRAVSLAGASRMYSSLVPAAALELVSEAPTREMNPPVRLDPYGMGKRQLAWAAAVLVSCLLLPSTMQLFRAPLRGRWRMGWRSWTAGYSWRPSMGWAVVTAFGLAFGLLQALSAAPTPFLYFQF